MALPGIALSGAASLLFAVGGSSLAVLFAARFLQGAVSGAVFSVGSAWVTELSAATGLAAGGRRAAFAMTAGFSLGPLAGGLLGQFAPAPTVLPYLVHAAVALIGFLLAVPLAETVAASVRTGHGAAHHERVPVVAPGQWPLLLTVLTPIAICVYAFPSSMVSAVPLLGKLPASGVAVVGLLGGVTLGAGALVAGLQARLGPWTAVVGAASGAVGFTCAAFFVATDGLLWLFAGALLLGGGSGLCLAAGLATIARIAPSVHRGALNSWFLACAYLGFAAPFLMATAARSMSGVVPLMVAALLAAAGALRLVSAARRRQI